MELRQIHYFIEVAKSEHVTEAALNLHVAQSAISRQIANLEEELGVDLFERAGRNVELTPVGHLFLEHVEVAMLEVDHAVEKVKEFLNPETGIIRVGFPNSLSADTLPNVISSFRDKYPNITLKVQQGGLRYLMESVRKGRMNLAFVTPVPMNEKELTGRIFFTEEMAALLPDHHFLADQHAIHLDQLRHDGFVLFRTGIRKNIILDACKYAGFNPQIAFEGEDFDTIKNLVASGLGVSLLPETALINQIPLRTVKKSLLGPAITRTVGVITPKKSILVPSEKLFYDFLIDFYDTLNRFGQ